MAAAAAGNYFGVALIRQAYKRYIFPEFWFAYRKHPLILDGEW